ncbi:MAG: type II toxin-antitoxin system Phd/YefM family antitoxin [Syntrophobacteraceae bacterium]
MPLTVGAFEAKTQLSKLLNLVSKGEKVIITKHGVPVAELSPPVHGRGADISEIAEELRAIRNRSKPGADSIRSMIEKGRRQ